MNQQALTINDLLRVLAARKLLCAVIFLAVVEAGMVMTFLTKPTYESTMKLLVTRQRIDPQITAGEKNSELPRGELSEEEFNSELEILQSRAVLENVAKQLGLAAPQNNAASGWLPSWSARRGVTPLEEAVNGLSNSLAVTPVKKSHILKVTYSSADPERPALVLNELFRQYAEHQLHLRQNGRVVSVFREQSADFERQLKAATNALKQFDAANGLTGNAAQKELLLRQFYDLQNQLGETRTATRETEQRLATFKAQLAAQPERIEAQVTTRYVGARDKLKEEILTLEMRRTELRQKYLPTHRLVTDVEERLAQARAMLAQEEQTPPQERVTVLNEMHRRLNNDLLTAQANLAALEKREQSLLALTGQYQAQLTKLDAKSLERAELERARAVNEEAYLLYHKKAQEAEIVNVLNQEKIANVSLAEPATANHQPVSPKPLVNLAALILVGLLASVTTVLFLERDKLIVKRAPAVLAAAPAPPMLPSAAPTLLIGLQRLRLLEAEPDPAPPKRRVSGALPSAVQKRTAVFEAQPHNVAKFPEPGQRRT